VQQARQQAGRAQDSEEVKLAELVFIFSSGDGYKRLVMYKVDLEGEITDMEIKSREVMYYLHRQCVAEERWNVPAPIKEKYVNTRPGEASYKTNMTEHITKYSVLVKKNKDSVPSKRLYFNKQLADANKRCFHYFQCEFLRLAGAVLENDAWNEIVGPCSVQPAAYISANCNWSNLELKIFGIDTSKADDCWRMNSNGVVQLRSQARDIAMEADFYEFDAKKHKALNKKLRMW
jgi:hypothetical protein